MTTQAFAAGEQVSVTVPASIVNTVGASTNREVYRFTAATGGTGRGFFLDTATVASTSSRDQLLGDIDNDGDLDLLTSNGLFGMFSYHNNGTGRFTPGANVAVARTPSGASLADFNQDGWLDLIAGDADNSAVAVALNNGAGSFGIGGLATQTLTVAGTVSAVATGDVDADGDIDFVSANMGSNTASVGFNNGSGHFTSVTTVSVGTQPAAVQLGDIDNDGDLDLLTANRVSNTVSVRLNNGSGSFSGTGTLGMGTTPSDLALADLDHDGDLDMLTANAGNSTVSIRLNNGSGTFGSATNLVLPVGSSPTGLGIGDVDADGDLDVLVAQGYGGKVFTYLNNGSGILSLQYAPLEMSYARGVPTTLGITLGDVDGDLDLDLVTASAGEVVLARNGGTPVVPAPTLVGFSPAAGPAGATGIRLAGSSLSSTTAVQFNGVAASYTIDSDQQLTATVPVGASTGPLSITTAGGSVTSTQSFTVTAGPVAPVLLTGIVPSRHAVAASTTAPVQASFDSPISAASAGAVRVFGAQRRGRQQAVVSGGGTATLTITPNPAFAPGERVSVSLPAMLTGTTGGAVRPQVVEFLTATGGTGEGIFTAGTSTPLALRTHQL